MTRAEQLNQYVAELEHYVTMHGHLPAPSRSTPATNRTRLQQALHSPRTAEDMKRRIGNLLEARSYANRRKLETVKRPGRKLNTAAVLEYLDLLEAYVKEHGHLPSTADKATPRTDKPRLNRYLNRPELSEAVKRRIQALLACTGPAEVRAEVAQEDFDAIPAGLGDLSKPLSASQLEVVDWIVANRKLPAYRGGGSQERRFYQILSEVRRSVTRGSSTLRTTEFALLIPGLLRAAEREKASAHASAKRAEAAARPSRKTHLGSLEDRWNKGFEELSAWVATHGTLPRRRTFDEKEYRVANWLNVQRMQLRDNNLRPAWKVRLATIPGALEPREQIRDEADLARTVADFYERHGRLPRADAPAPESTVGVRLRKLRTRIANRSIGRDALQILSGIPGATEATFRKPPYERLADLQEFVRTTGTFPANDSGGLSHWAHRALRGEGSKRKPEAAELRRAVEELRESVPYQVTRKKSSLAAYVTELEGYVSRHGHLPTSTQGASPRFSAYRLQRALETGTTDDVLSARIRNLLAGKPYKAGRMAA